MNQFKKTVKNWLNQIGKDRYWLAQQLQKPKRTIDNWLSPSYRHTPPKWQAVITRLIDQTTSPAPANRLRQTPPISRITLKYTTQEWETIMQYQKTHPNADIRRLARQSIVKWANNIKKTPGRRLR